MMFFGKVSFIDLFILYNIVPHTLNTIAEMGCTENENELLIDDFKRMMKNFP